MEDGLRSLAKLHAHGDENNAWVRAEFDQIQEMITYEHEHEAKSYVELFTNRSSFRRLFLACSIQASVQMTGVSAIQYYSPTIFAQIGIPTNKTLQYQGINSIIALLGEFSCIMLIDRVGRRWAMIGGNLGNCVTFIIATALLAQFPPGVSRNIGAGWGFTLMTWVYNFSFSATCGPLSWIVPAEIFDTRTRAKGVSIGVMVSFAFNTLIGQITPIAMAAVGWRYYLLFVSTLKSSGYISDSLIALIGYMQFYKCHLFLGHPAGDEEAAARRDELPLHQCADIRADHEHEGLRTA